MRFPFQRRQAEAATEAREALEKAERDLAATKAETPKYLRLAVALREVRDENHLAQALTKSFRSDP
jgi:hypothetical protein